MRRNKHGYWPKGRIAILSGYFVFAVAGATESDDGAIEHLTIFGDQQVINDVPGAAYVVSEAELDKYNYTDIMRVLATVPGVYVLEEDGFGLRPNIGMRGTGQNRSEKVTILEDGVLAAPAPYAAPSAYYFPTIGRMQRVEVLKGTSSAVYGPRTTGGVINLLSRTIPEKAVEGLIEVGAGEHGAGKLHTYVGGSQGRLGTLFELFRYQADGFRSINGTEDKAGFYKNDLLAKLRYEPGAANSEQLLEAKLKYSDENSDETYMGLTDDDFENRPYSRYAASKWDNMSTTHKQLQFNHEIHISNTVSLGSTAYYNDFQRNWYKVSKIGGQSLSSGGIDAISAFERGETAGNLSVDIKANNRSYLSHGLQSQLHIDTASHLLKIGARYHEDQMDRFQWVDTFALDQQLNLNQISAGIPGTDSNRIDAARALALYAQDELQLGNTLITGGIRYEQISLQRKDWGKADPARLSSPTLKRNELDIVLPSLALTYKVNDNTVLLAGVQKGFAPPSPGNSNARNEESVNYEIGGRFSRDKLSAETVLFFSDYENMHGNCTESQGCNIDNLGDQYNAGEVTVSGLELQASYDLQYRQLSVPVKFSYTYTETEFQNSFSSLLDTWGDVTGGDELPYVPAHQAQLGISIEADDWSANASLKFVGQVRTTAGSGTIPNQNQINGRVIMDFSARYLLSPQQSVSLLVENLLNKRYVATRVFGSAMAGKPRSASLEYRYHF